MNPKLSFSKDHYAKFINAFLGKHVDKLRGQFIQFVHIREDKKIIALSCHADSPKFLERAMKWHEQMGGIYISMGLRTTKFDPKRGDEYDMTGLVAFFCEVDVYGPGWHKGHDNLPLTIEAAEDLIRAAFPNHPPSMIVGSGGGIYIYWLLEDPWIFADEEERAQAMAILDGIFFTLSAVAHAQGLHVDNVADLARVLRVPGSVNFKIKDSPRPAVVRMLNEDLRYAPAQFLEIAAAVPVKKEKKKRGKNAKTDGKGVTSEAENPESENPESKKPEGEGKKEYPLADFDAVMAGCAYLQHCRDDARNLAEPDWWAMVSNIARCQDGPKHVHELSSPYLLYDYAETELKIGRALEGGGPHLCATIEANNGDKYCGTCPYKGKVKSPIVLGRARSKKDLLIEELNKEFAVIRTKNGCCILHEIIDPLTGYRDFDLLNGQSFALLLSNKKVYEKDENGELKVTPLSKVWLESAKRREFPGGVVMDPARATDPSKCYNIYSGLAVSPKPGNWQLFKEHIRVNIAGECEIIFAYILAWLANLMQFPGGPRPETAIVLVGKQGCGKSFLARIIGMLLGQHYLAISDQTHLTGRFTTHFAGCLLCFVDEALFAGDAAAAGIIKSRITEPTMMYEAKGRDPFPIANHTRYIIASNNARVIPAALEERRFLVLNVSDKQMQNHKYFAAIQAEMDAGGYEAMLHDLLQMDLSKVNLRQIPRTQPLLDQIMHSLPPGQKYWLDCLHRGGSYSSTPDYEKSFKDDLSWVFGEDGMSIPPRLLYTDYLAWVNAAKVRYPGTEDAFYKDLRKICEVVKLQKTVRGVGRQWCYQIPSLAQCRAQFETQVNLKVVWFDEESEAMAPPASKPIEMPEYSIPDECFANEPTSSRPALAFQ
jgi:hypothetical protein